MPRKFDGKAEHSAPVTAAAVRRLIRRTGHCLYARVDGLDHNIKVVGVITQHGSPIVAATDGGFYSLSQIRGWIDGRTGQTVTP